MRRSKLRDRSLALAIGVVIAAAFLGAFVYWTLTYVHGTEACVLCDVERDVDRRGPFWMYSDPRPAHRFTTPAPNKAPCDEHTWQRVGCWVSGNWVACYGTARRSLAVTPR